MKNKVINRFELLSTCLFLHILSYMWFIVYTQLGLSYYFLLSANCVWRANIFCHIHVCLGLLTEKATFLWTYGTKRKKKVMTRILLWMFEINHKCCVQLDCLFTKLKSGGSVALILSQKPKTMWFGNEVCYANTFYKLCLNLG